MSKREKDIFALQSKIFKTDVLIRRLEARVSSLQRRMGAVGGGLINKKTLLKLEGSKCSEKV